MKRILLSLILILSAIFISLIEDVDDLDKALDKFESDQRERLKGKK